jgi:ADP-heptose:LPS heptosyltransferase
MENVISRPSSRKKRALVARLGGLGDVIIASSIFEGLKNKGFSVDFLCVEEMAEVVEHDPNLSNVLTLKKTPEGTESVIAFFKTQALVYDEVFHLSETIERMLLFRNNCLQFYWPDEARRAFANRSYLELVHEFASVPPPYQPGFWATDAETMQAKSYIENWGGGRVIAIQALGSNFDKLFPFMDVVATKLLTIPDVRIMVLANGRRSHEVAFCEAMHRHIESEHGKTDRVRFALNKPLRWALTFARQADVLIGPDTGMMWSVAANRHVGKVLLLSHASPENITKHWVRTATLHADQTKVSCWPCHKLHDDQSTCRIDPVTKAASCISNIHPAAVVKAALIALKEKHDGE